MAYPRVTGSPGQRFWSGRVGSRVSVSDPVFDLVLNFNIHVFGVISIQSIAIHLGIIYLPNFMPSSLKAHILTIYCFLVNLFKLVPVIFTYLRAHCSLSIICFKTLSDRVGSPGQKPPGRVGSRVKNPDPVPSLG